jgi:catecholate siderophore receptor
MSKMLRCVMGLGAGLLMVCGPAWADEAEEEAAETDAPIIVTGQRNGYLVKDSASSTKTATPLLDTPQSLTIVSQVFIEDANLRSISDIIRFTPGASPGQGEGNRDQLTLRGVNTTADFFVDGLRDDVQYFRPLYNVERVEILKGANALAFGRGGGGGVINRVNKTAGPGNFGALSGGVDTFGAYAFEGDANAEIGEHVFGRIGAFYEDARNHRDVYSLERFGATPTLTWQPSSATRLVLAYEYLRDFRVADRGIPSLNGRPIAGFRDAFFGVPGLNESDLTAHIVRARIEHRISAELSVSGQFSWGDYAKAYRNVFPATAVSIDPRTGAASLGIEAYFDPTHRRNVYGQANVEWRTQTGPIAHRLLAGIEAGNAATQNQRINGFFDSSSPTSVSGRRVSVGLADPLIVPPITFRAGPANRNVTSDGNVVSIYVQDQAEFGDFQLIAGGRYDRFALDIANLIDTTRFSRVDDVISPRAGLVYKPIAAASLYASFARSFLPQSGEQFLSLDASLSALAPERFDSYEIGGKWDVLPGLNLTTALYQIERTNSRAPSGQAGVVVLTGESRTRGLELSLLGSLRPHWQIYGGYTYQDAQITSTTAAAPAGRQIGQVPHHLFFLWSRYDFTQRLGASLGLQHQRDSFTTISNTTILPGFTRLDGALYFALTPRLEAQIQIENLTNAQYFPTAHTDNNISTGPPRNARLTLRAKF